MFNIFCVFLVISESYCRDIIFHAYEYYISIVLYFCYVYIDYVYNA